MAGAGLGRTPITLALFPLQSVLFPDAVLPLKVFEARYLDLVGRCLRERSLFGVVCLRQGRDAGRDGVHFEREGVLARIDAVDAEQVGILQVRCTGTHRFVIEGEPRQERDGLWMADVMLQADDEVQAPEAALLGVWAAEVCRSHEVARFGWRRADLRACAGRSRDVEPA